MKILVASPHPDDETLGAGGTILKMAANGHEVYWLNFTAMLNADRFSNDVKERRKKQLQEIEHFIVFRVFIT